MRKNRFHIKKVHPLLDTALHPNEAQPKLIFEQFPDGSYSTIPQVIDIVDFPLADLQIHEIPDDFNNILCGERSLFEWQIQSKLLIELEATYRRKVVPLGVQKKIIEQGPRSID